MKWICKINNLCVIFRNNYCEYLLNPLFEMKCLFASLYMNGVFHLWRICACPILAEQRTTSTLKHINVVVGPRPQLDRLTHTNQTLTQINLIKDLYIEGVAAMVSVWQCWMFIQDSIELQTQHVNTTLSRDLTVVVGAASVVRAIRQVQATAVSYILLSINQSIFVFWGGRLHTYPTSRRNKKQLKS